MPAPVILSGGVGSRLWSVSRESYPRRCIPLVDGQLSLLPQTMMRVADCEQFSAPIIVCDQERRFLIAEQARQVDISPRAILLEPVVGGNTAPAVALAALKARIAGDDPLLLVLPAGKSRPDTTGTD